MTDLIVHQLPGAWGLPSISPFCLKLDLHLRIVGLPFGTVIDATPFRGPKGKLPWIEHDGRRIGDSNLIVEYLTQRLGSDADRGLSAPERGIARAFRGLIEEHLYWAMVYDRWMVDEHWTVFREVVLGALPAPLRLVIGPVARRGVARQLRGHGLGLHARDEIYAFGCGDIQAIADFLGDKPFLMGSDPTGIDAVAYGLLANVARPPFDSPLRRAVVERPNLVGYLQRIETRYFGAGAEG